MVRKSSLFGRLFTKREHDPRQAGPGARPGAPAAPKAAPAGAGNGKGGRPEVRAALEAEKALRPELRPPAPELREVPVVEPVETKPVRKEDAQRAVVTGLQDLSNLLQGIQGQMETQGERSGRLLEKFQDLPETARAQIQFLERITSHLESQQLQSAQLLEKFGQIPDLLAGVRQILASQQAADERRDLTLGRFRETMERINAGIGALNQDNARAMQETAQSFEKGHAESVKVFERTQRQTLDTFQKAAETQTRTLGNLLQGAQRQNRVILVFLVLSFVAMGALAAGLLLGRW